MSYTNEAKSNDSYTNEAQSSDLWNNTADYLLQESSVNEDRILWEDGGGIILGGDYIAQSNYTNESQ